MARRGTSPLFFLVSVCRQSHFEGRSCSALTVLSHWNRNQEGMVFVESIVQGDRPSVCIQPDSSRFGCFSPLHFLIALGHRRYGSGLQLIHFWCSSEVGRPFLSANIVPHTAPSLLVFIHSASNSGSTCTFVFRLYHASC
jgi:hypothetical protein